MSDQGPWRAYWQQRILALRHEYELATGTKTAAVPTVMADVVEALRATGNGSLADRVSVAFTRAEDAMSRWEAVQRDDVIDEHARDAMATAVADLERLLVDAIAWLDAGGAVH